MKQTKNKRCRGEETALTSRADFYKIDPECRDFQKIPSAVDWSVFGAWNEIDSVQVSGRFGPERFRPGAEDGRGPGFRKDFGGRPSSTNSTDAGSRPSRTCPVLLNLEQINI